MKTFGDIIKLDGKEYVFLASTDDVLYLARIPDIVLSQEFIKRRDQAFSIGSKNMPAKQQSKAWCFVELTTKDFEERIALYGYPDTNLTTEDLMDLIGTLSKEDKELLKQEITQDSAVSKGLIEVVKNTKID